MVEHFEQNGFTIVRGALQPDLVRKLTIDLAALVELARDHGGLVDASTGAGPVWQIVSPHHHAPIALDVLRQPAIAQTALECLRCDSIQLLQDAVVAKPARVGGSIGWHQDHTYTGFLRPAKLLSIRVALGTEDAAHGGLRVLAGSHRWGIARRDGFAATALQTDELGAARNVVGDDVIQAAKQEVTLEPGDVSLHHCRTFHSSTENLSEVDRLTLVAHVFDATCQLERESLPTDHVMRFPTRADGTLDPERFPAIAGFDRDL